MRRSPTRRRTVAALLLTLVPALAAGAGATSARVPPEPAAEVAMFRQGERDFANRHGHLPSARCDTTPEYGDGPCATRRRT